MRRNMATFTAHGPFAVPYEKRPGGRVFSKEKLDTFWEASGPKEFRGRKGLYVFAIKPPATSRFTPFYIGQTRRDFGSEVFTDHKINKYHGALCHYERGAPYLFLIVHPKHKLNARHITEIEDYLIISGKEVNPDLENERGTSGPDWAIQGVLGTEARGASHAAKAIKAMFSI